MLVSKTFKNGINSEATVTIFSTTSASDLETSATSESAASGIRGRLDADKMLPRDIVVHVKDIYKQYKTK